MDKVDDCSAWQKLGFCDHTWDAFMAANCRVSCGLCDDDSKSDSSSGSGSDDSSEDTLEPTDMPTFEPTALPTFEPTADPTFEPTEEMGDDDYSFANFKEYQDWCNESDTAEQCDFCGGKFKKSKSKCKAVSKADKIKCKQVNPLLCAAVGCDWNEKKVKCSGESTWA